jgi:hypothetical protein
MRVKADLPQTNEVRIVSHQALSLARVSELEDFDAQRVERRITYMQLGFSGNVVIDVMDELLPLSRREFFFSCSDCAVLMHLWCTATVLLARL